MTFIKTFFLQYLKPIALPVTFSALQEADRSKSVLEGCAIVLSCELTRDSSTQVHWYKDGLKLLQQDNVEIQSEGPRRALFIHSAEQAHSGTYQCSTVDDTVTFKVDVQGELFLALFLSHIMSYCLML